MMDHISLGKIAEGQAFFTEPLYGESLCEDVPFNVIMDLAFDAFVKAFERDIGFTPKALDVSHTVTLDMVNNGYRVKTRWSPTSSKARLVRDGYVIKHSVTIKSRYTPYYMPVTFPSDNMGISNDRTLGLTVPKLKFTCAAWDNIARCWIFSNEE